MAGMFIEGRKIRNFADVQRNYNYEITFVNAASLVDGWNDEDVTLRARSFTIPQRGNEAIESNYGAMKQFFAGKPTFSNTMDVIFEETESQGVARFLHAWQQKIFNINDGHANYSRKRGTNGGTIAIDGICDTIIIRAQRQDGAVEDNKYFLINAWLQNVGEVNIDFNQAGDGVKFTATLQFDFWSYGTEAPTFGTGGSGEIVGTNSDISEK
jgi:hypothetical protein